MMPGIETAKSVPLSIEVDMSDDGLHAREPNGEHYARNLNIDGGANYQRNVDAPDLKFPRPFPFDHQLIHDIRARPNLKVITNSLAFLTVTFKKGAPLCGSGALLRPDLLITCIHNFDENRDIKNITVESFTSRRIATGRLLKIPEQVLNCIDEDLVMDHGSNRDYIDFALVKLDEPVVEESIELLKFPSSHFLEKGETIVSAGKPATPLCEDFSYTSCFSSPVLRMNKKVSPSRLEDLLKGYYLDTVDHYKSSIACFGSYTGQVSDFNSCYYFRSTASSVSGTSGGPVVSLKCPDEIIGIHVGDYVGDNESFHLKLNSPPILQILEYYFPREYRHDLL